MSNQPLSLFEISGRAMAAQLVRLNTTASNLANAGTISGSEQNAFRSLKPVFRTVMGENGTATVAIDKIVSSPAAPTKRHDPAQPRSIALPRWSRCSKHRASTRTTSRSFKPRRA
jgi:flagellar basal-body rod protein FlgC